MATSHDAPYRHYLREWREFRGLTQDDLALLAGTSRRDAFTLGVLMNTRGLTEIVILTVGLELGVIDTTMFSIGVVMALATTMIASPLLRLVRPDVAATVPRTA